MQNELVQDAAIRNLEILGEASNYIQKHYPGAARLADDKAHMIQASERIARRMELRAVVAFLQRQLLWDAALRTRRSRPDPARHRVAKM
ncbi:hypothetical protein [Rugamonas apoptosis]|uniref:hypothetical protein n=1 Tax=Rugamonas apoptosis TaxID=2758570 RepID=UPI0035CCF8F6